MDIGSILIGMIITAFAYLLVPIILAIRGKHVKVKTVALINFIVVYIVLTVVIIELGGENTSAGGIIWAWLGYYILKKKCSPKDEKTKINQSVVCSEENSDNPMTISEVGEIRTVVHENTVNEEKKLKNKFCSKCGAIVDSETKKCTGCGKQYFRGFGKRFAWVLVIILLICVIVESIVLLNMYGSLITYKENYFEKNEMVMEQKEKISDLNNEIYDLQADWNFIDEYVVFIADDGTYLYHKYSCEKFKNASSFWTFNINYAQEDGYRPCPDCH